MIGAIRWFIETVTYFISIILGLFLIVIAMIILFLPMWFSAKFGQMIVDVLKGRHERAISELGEVVMAPSKLTGGGS